MRSTAPRFVPENTLPLRGGVPAGLLLALLAVTSCTSVRGLSPQSAEYGLTLSVGELQMHLRADTYRTFEHVRHDGRNSFQVVLWRLDQLEAHRAVQYPLSWQDEDIVIEFARARALERLRRYEESRAAYQRIAWLGRLLAEPAKRRLDVVQLLAAHAAVPLNVSIHPERELSFINAWSAQWRSLARLLRETSFSPLAWQEAEAWEQTRVQYFVSRGRLPTAIRACRRLIRRHRDSKLYPRHLIRLGDLHAEAARVQYASSRTQPALFDASLYEVDIDRAFSAYELASESRKPTLRREAQNKIQALLAYHEGVRSDVR